MYATKMVFVHPCPNDKSIRTITARKLSLNLKCSDSSLWRFVSVQGQPCISLCLCAQPTNEDKLELGQFFWNPSCRNCVSSIDIHTSRCAMLGFQATLPCWLYLTFGGLIEKLNFSWGLSTLNHFAIRDCRIGRLYTRRLSFIIVSSHYISFFFK